MRKFWVFLILTAAVVTGVSIYAYRKKNTLEIAYREIKVERSDLEVTILATGTVEPQNRLEIKPPVAGRVEEVLVKEGQRVVKGQVLAWMSSTERAALLDAARSQGAEAVRQWERNYKPTPILAPINGTIILQAVKSGQTFTNVDSVLVMSDRLTVKSQVDETDIAEIKLKQAAKITLDAYPTEVINGRVDQIAYDAKTVNNVTTYVVDVLPEHTPDTMRSGMTANVTFQINAKNRVLVVPNDALRVQDNKYTVLVKATDKNLKPWERPVEVGITDGKRTEITSGLADGEIVLAAEIKPLKDKKPTQGSNPLSPQGRPRGIGRR